MFNKKSLPLVAALPLLFAQPILADTHTHADTDVSANAHTKIMTPPEVCIQVDAKMVAGFFDRWNKSLATNNPDKVVANYAENGVLLPTLSNVPRTNHLQIRDYFVNFLKKSPVGHIDQRTISIGCNWATDTGLYTFATTDKDSNKSDVAARYSFVYEYIDGQWLIVHHHSSLMPENKANEDGDKDEDNDSDD